MKIASLIKLVISIVICIGAGLLPSPITASSMDWYQTLNKPFFNPPNWIFAPVWTVLYLLMGISAFLIWQKGLENKQVRVALIIFLVQLVLNVVWTPLFFGLKMQLIAFIDILLLWDVILLTIIHFHKLSRPAAMLLIPYLLWVSFAVILNLSIVILNR